MGDVIGGIGSLVGGIMTSNASKSAASAEVNALQQGINFNQGVYSNAQSNLAPYIGGGQQALTSLLGFYGLGPNPAGAAAGYQAFTQTPTYQFAQQQGLLGLNRQLAAAGLSGSGAAAKEGAQYTQGLASQQLQSYLSGLGGIAGSGQSAAGTLASAGAGIGQTLNQAYGNQGLATAGGIMGSNNALQQGIQGALSPLGSFANGLLGAPAPQSQSSFSSANWLGTQLGNWTGLNTPSPPSYGMGAVPYNVSA
jgi:hypothetical protein